MRIDIRWSKVSIAAIVMAGVVAVGVVVPLVVEKARELRELREAELHPRPASDSEEIAILRGVLKDEFFTSWELPAPPDGSPRPPGWFRASDSLVLSGSTLRTCGSLPDGVWQEFGCISAQDRENEGLFILDRKISTKLLQELFAANQHSSLLPDAHDPAILYRSAAEVGNLARSPDRSNRFYASFPHSKYGIEVSRAVLSSDGAHALIHVQLWFCPLAEQDVLYYLVRTGRTWRVEIASGPVIT